MSLEHARLITPIEPPAPTVALLAYTADQVCAALQVSKVTL